MGLSRPCALYCSTRTFLCAHKVSKTRIMNGTTKTSVRADSGPVTVVIRRRIKRGFAKAYEQLEKEISADASAFPGYLGCTFLRPERDDDRDFVTIVRFASYKSMMQWEHSTTGSAFIDRADAMSELPATIRRTTGLSLWFNPRHPASPQRWKMVLVLTCLLYTSDAADEEDSVDLGGRRIIKKKKKKKEKKESYKK